MSTRSTLILLTLLLIIGGSAQAGGAFGLGVKGGLSFASANNEYDPPVIDIDPEWRTGFAVGVYVDHTLLPFLSLRPEALYIQKGSKLSIEETTEAYPLGTGRYIEVFNRTNYLSLQLLARVKAPGAGPSPYLLAGPRLDFKLSADSDDPNFPSGDAKTAVLGGTLGGGFGIPVGPATTLMLEFQYFLDFGDAVDYTTMSGGETTNLTVTNKSCMVTVGLMF